VIGHLRPQLAPLQRGLAAAQHEVAVLERLALTHTRSRALSKSVAERASIDLVLGRVRMDHDLAVSVVNHHRVAIDVLLDQAVVR
jgi:hypothetical protein